MKTRLPKWDYQNWKFRNFVETLKSGHNFGIHTKLQSTNQIYKMSKNSTIYKTLVIGEAVNAISGCSLTNNNYVEAINILKDRFSNKQIIISSHMNSLLKLTMVKKNDLQRLRSFYDEMELNVRSLVTLGVAIESFGTLVSTVVIDKQFIINSPWILNFSLPDT